MNSTQGEKKEAGGQGPNTVLIIIIIIVAVLVLGIAGWWGLRYYANKSAEKLTEELTTTLKEPTSPTLPTTPTTLPEPTTPSITPETTVPTDEKTGATPADGYIIDDSDTRIISESELAGHTPWQLKVARNEIYARHGREFVHKDLQCYFRAQSWYSINPNFSETLLSNTENKNIATILNYEEKMNSPLLRKDSGC